MRASEKENPMFENVVQTDSGRYLVQVCDLDEPTMKCTLKQSEVNAIKRYLLSKVAMCLDAEADCRKMDPLGGDLAIRDELRDWQQKRETIEMLLGQLPMPVRKKAAKAAAKANKAPAKAKVSHKRAKPTPEARETLAKILIKRPKSS
jgi:hypothetical protein